MRDAHRSSQDKAEREESIHTFEAIAKNLGLSVVTWRDVPRDSSILGPISKKSEPVLLQPFVVPRTVSVCPVADAR
jgi:glutamate synthase (NADPH/NADH)